MRAESSHAPPYVQLTTDQRATEPGEQSRILKAGGQISDGRVWGALIPSRTLGDFPWKAKGPGLSALPEFCSYEIGPDDRYVILGSDGLFDVLTNKAIARIAGRMSGKAQKVANELVKELKKRPGHDDQTLVVVALEHERWARAAASRTLDCRNCTAFTNELFERLTQDLVERREEDRVVE